MTTPLPTLFISHGAPSLVLEDVPARDFLAGLAATLPRPRAIVVASAHWLTNEPTVDTSARPRTIHDFSGFPAEMYQMRYTAPGSPELATRIQELLRAGGLACRGEERGLDHGAWVPLTLVYPQADVPVLQVSLQPQLGAAHHLRLGELLAPLRHEGVLVIGSGSATHNLRELAPGAPTPAWAADFAAWLTAAVVAGDATALTDYLRVAPAAQRNHPTAEHYLPLLVALGAAGPRARGRALHGSFTYGSLSMAMFAFGA